MKYNRNYEVFIQQQNSKDLRIGLPFSLEFEIFRNSYSSANVASFRFYNLAPNTRAQIRKEGRDYGSIRSMSFQAGYGDKLSLGFVGNISQAWSTREGSNVITQIESYDGGYAYVNAAIDTQFPKGTNRTTIIQAVMKSLPGIKTGAIGDTSGSISRGNSVTGNSMEQLTQLTGGNAFIDNGTVHVLGETECLEGPVILINSATGMLGTPVRENTYVTVETLFEPTLQIGRQVRIESATAEHFTGLYRVIAVRHKGTISESVSGSATSSVTLLPGNFAPIRVGS